MEHRITGGLAATLLCLAAAGCGELDGRPQAAVAEHRPVHVDSILPVEEELRRFRAALPDTVGVLDGGASSLEALVAGFLQALEVRDRPRLEALRISAAEFAWLYYPESRYTTPPYAMGPGLLWFQLENHGSRGLDRALARYGGRPLQHAGHACDEAPEAEGASRFHRGCVIRFVGAAGDTAGLALFGPILERDGRFKFVSYANRL
jgi:hypothetical protein